MYHHSRDHATKETLQNNKNGDTKGIDLNDFNAAGRQAPLLLVSRNEVDSYRADIIDEFIEVPHKV